MCGTKSISLMATKIWSLVPQEMENCQSSYSFKGRYKEMETMLSMSVMQTLLATCWFFIIKISVIWITLLFVLLICYFIYMLYNICIFFFFCIFPHWKVDADLKTKGLLIYQIHEFANHFASELSPVFFGEGRRFRVISFFHNYKVM